MLINCCTCNHTVVSGFCWICLPLHSTAALLTRRVVIFVKQKSPSPKSVQNIVVANISPSKYVHINPTYVRNTYSTMVVVADERKTVGGHVMALARHIQAD